MGELSICVPFISVLTIRFSKKCYFFNFAPFSNLSSSATTSSSSPIPKEIFSQKVTLIVEYWGEEPLLLFVASESGKSKISEKKPVINNFSRHSNSSSFVSHNYRLHFLDQSLNENFLYGKETRLYFCGFCSLHWNTDLPIFQKMLFIMLHLHIETLNFP